MLKIRRNVVKTMTIGMTTIFQFSVYDDGTTSEPSVIKSYNFTPNAVKKTIERKTMKISVDEAGEM